MQSLRLYARPTESETLGVGLVICVLTSLVCDSDMLNFVCNMKLRGEYWAGV